MSKLQSDLSDQLNYSIGQKIRLRRNLLGLSQKKLAEAIGVTFQQIQKYEKGLNRITISRLQDISQILGVDVSFFVNKVPTQKTPTPVATYDMPAGQGTIVLAEKPVLAYETEIGLEQLTTREALQLIKAYYKIQNPQARRKVIDLVTLMAEEKGKD